jgi:hypothetical protein
MLKKVPLLIILLLLLVGIAALVWFISRPNKTDETVVSRLAKTSGRPAFVVEVEKPRMDRPLGGILPSILETKLVGELRFDQTSPGAKFGNVSQTRLELSADGWDLLIVTDDKGNVTSGTRLIFPIEIAEKLWSLRCRPADQPAGSLEKTARVGSDVLDGHFLIELAKCEDAATGKILDREAGGSRGNAWPQSPLTLRGSFAGLPQSHP